MRLDGTRSEPVLATVCTLVCLASPFPVSAGATDQLAPTSWITPSPGVDSSTSNRYGLFNWLDHRSEYGQGVFPEPFLVDDSDLEPNEARLDWLHTKGGDQHSDLLKAEVEKAFGLMTLELEIPYERDVSSGEVSQGFANIALGARYPVYQFVSQGGLVDSTFGVGVELAVPTGSAISKNTELVPKVFDDLKVGNLTAQSILGYSAIFGPGDDGGLQTFEYGFVFGFTVPHRRLPLPGVQELIPVFELKGETGLSKENSGHSSLLGDLGFRVNLNALGQFQPRLGAGFVFPVDEGARGDMHWGVVTSLVIQY